MRSGSYPGANFVASVGCPTDSCAFPRNHHPVGRGALRLPLCAEMRKKLFTDGVLAKIPHWMREEGLGPAELAARIGCTVGSLRVACSRYGLSLRRPTGRLRDSDRQYNQATPSRPDPAELGLSLPEEIRDRLRARAASLGMSELELLALLIETIDRDDLYSAILDDGR
jgi:hypothetical protein